MSNEITSAPASPVARIGSSTPNAGSPDWAQRATELPLWAMVILAVMALALLLTGGYFFGPVAALSCAVVGTAGMVVLYAATWLEHNDYAVAPLVLCVAVVLLVYAVMLLTGVFGLPGASLLPDTNLAPPAPSTGP